MSMTEAILRTLRHGAGVDFAGYRPQTVERRIRNRMMSLGIEDFERYEQLLRASGHEIESLVERLTIKVSRFYRNAPVFDSLRNDVLPQLARLGRPVRVWSAGCGRGEEAYTLAMLLEEAGIAGTVTATDLDPAALRAAREAEYAEAALAELPQPLAQAFMERVPSLTTRWRVRERVRARVDFQPGDLTTPAGRASAPFDLACCRNVLIYWSPPVQKTILQGIVASLAEGAFLCLGEAEWPDAHAAARLDVTAPRLRIFRLRAGEPA